MFVTFKRTNIKKPIQLDVDYFLQNFDKLYKIEDTRLVTDYPRFHTIWVGDAESRPDLKQHVINNKYWEVLEKLAEKAEELCTQDINSLYEKFYIPKRAGGFREINAPQGELKQFQTALKDYIQDGMHVLPHDTAYAYVKNRCTRQAVERHQENKSKWFLKIDISDFFPSCDKDLILNSLQNLYPFYYMKERHNYEEVMSTIVDACLLDGGLPQGSPVSPLLSNLVMVSVDHALHLFLRKNQFIYTRYADDILISSQYSFGWKELQAKVGALLTEKSNGKWVIKETKTRYGSAAGRNWNLGLMLNKDNEITVGHKKKRLFKVMLNNFVTCYNACDVLPKEAIQHLQGLYSYYSAIEPEYFNTLVNRYSEKMNDKRNILEVFTELLSM